MFSEKYDFIEREGVLFELTNYTRIWLFRAKVHWQFAWEVFLNLSKTGGRIVCCFRFAVIYKCFYSRTCRFLGGSVLAFRWIDFRQQDTFYFSGRFGTQICRKVDVSVIKNMNQLIHNYTTFKIFLVITSMYILTMPKRPVAETYCYLNFKGAILWWAAVDSSLWKDFSCDF